LTTPPALEQQRADKPLPLYGSKQKTNRKPSVKIAPPTSVYMQFLSPETTSCSTTSHRSAHPNPNPSRELLSNHVHLKRAKVNHHVNIYRS